MAEIFAPEFVNREIQVDFFEQILAGTLDRRVFLIEGDPEIGKSFLLDQFLFMAGWLRYSRLDFRDGETHTFLSLIQAAIRDLGVSFFSRTQAEINNITQGIRHNVRVHGEAIHKPDRIAWDRWREMLGQYFNEEELKNISFDLNVDYEDFPGDGKSAFARELLAHMRRAGRHMELLQRLGQVRPNVAWHEVISPTTAENSLSGPTDGRLNVYQGGGFLPPITDPFQQYTLQQQISLTFIDELQRLASDGPIILSYDSFEEAPLETQKWVSGVLLDELARGHIPGVIVLLSGRHVLEVTRMLEPITIQASLTNFDLETVTEYWVRRQELPLEVVAAIFQETAGHPKKLAESAIAAGAKKFTTQIIRI